MSEFVRVRSAAGKESTISQAFVDGLEKGAVEILDEPATNTWGRVLPATSKNGRAEKPRTTVSQSAKKKSASK